MHVLQAPARVKGTLSLASTSKTVVGVGLARDGAIHVEGTASLDGAFELASLGAPLPEGAQRVVLTASLITGGFSGATLVYSAPSPGPAAPASPPPPAPFQESAVARFAGNAHHHRRIATRATVDDIAIQCTTTTCTVTALDTIAPVFVNVSVQLASITQTSALANVTINEDGKVWCSAVLSGAPAPTIAEVSMRTRRRRLEYQW